MPRERFRPGGWSLGCGPYMVSDINGGYVRFEDYEADVTAVQRRLNNQIILTDSLRLTLGIANKAVVHHRNRVEELEAKLKDLPEIEETCKELGHAAALAIQQRNQARDELAKLKGTV